MQKASPDNQATLGSLAESARKTKDGKLPPVHLWNPPFCGDLDMRIAAMALGFIKALRLGARLWWFCLPLLSARMGMIIFW